MITVDRPLLLGVGIDRRPLAALMDEAIAAIDRKISPVVFACANPHSLVVAQRDGFFRLALNRATHVVADGVGVTLMANLAQIAVGPRITGTDYFFALMGKLDHRGSGRVFFFGSSERVLQMLAANVSKHFPNLTICGTYSPPFRSWSTEENSNMVEHINQTKPDVVWVSMTAPKQEKWVENNRTVLKTAVIGSVGAVFDFVAGTHPRAPDWMCRMGIEWMYRLLKEPQRMWRRNFVSTPAFIAFVVSRHVLRLDRLTKKIS